MGIFDGGGKTWKPQDIGDTITGRIQSWREEQQHEFDRKTGKSSEKLATYDNGDPIMQLVVTLDTDVLDDEEDTGLRYVYVSSTRAKKAVVKAVRDAGVKAPEEGGTFTLTYVGLDPASFNGSAKAFTAAYQRPVQASQTFGTGGAAQQPSTQAPASAPQAAQSAEDPWAPADGLSADLSEKVRQLALMKLDAKTIAAALAGQGVTEAQAQAIVETVA